MKFYIPKITWCTVLFLLFSYHSTSQNLSITTNGETGTSGTNWSTSGTNPYTITASGGTASINRSVILEKLNDGISVIVQNNNSSGNVVLESGSGLTKNAGGDATLTLRANTQSVLHAPINSTLNKINVVLWSDFNNADVGGVALSAAAVINTNGGHFWAGGSSTPAGSYTWNGLTVGDGPSVGSIGANNFGMDLFTSQINTNGGHILLWSGKGHGSNNDGIGMNNNPHLNAGSGNVTLITRQIFVDSNTLSVTTTGKLSLATDASNPWTSDFNWATTTSGSNVTLTSALGRPLQINNFSSLGGLSLGVYDGFGASFNYTNFQNVNINSNIDILGSINVYAGAINYGIGMEVTARTAIGSINFQAKSGFFTVANIVGHNRGKLMTPDGGDITINADADNNNLGQLDIDWLTIDGRAGDILLEGSTFIWNTSAQITLPEFYSNLGTLTIRNVTSSNYVINTQWIAMFGTYSGVTFGRDGGTEAVLLNSCTVCDSAALNYGTTAFQIAGPITAFGGNINANFNLRSTNSGSDILLKATRSLVIGENVAVRSNNGDITFWSNADGIANATDGDFIGIYSGVSVNSANGLTNQLSGGGTITMAGGTTTQTLPSGTVVPTGYALSTRTTNWVGTLPPGGINFGEKTSSQGGLNTLNIHSGGGNIVVKGESNSSSAGIQWFSGSTGATQSINSGNGTVTIDGLSTNSLAHGIEFMSYASIVHPTVISSNTTSAAIQIKGETSSTVDRSGYQGTVILIANGIGGGIEVNGKVASASNYGAIEASSLNVYALSGPITFISEGGLGLRSGGTWGKGTLASSSSNITLKSDRIALYPATVETTGTVTVEPLGTSFASALTFPITNLTLGNTVSGLTIGKSNNTANITFANATTIAGPITAYGGDIAVNENLNTTSGSANGNILLKSAATISIAASKSIITNGGNITFWADNDANGTGGIKVDDSVTIDSRTNTDRTGNAHTTGGGKITFAGGLDDGGTASGTSLLTTGLVSNDGFPDGYAVNSGSGSSTTPNTGIVLGTIPTTPAGHNSNINIFSGSGDIRFNGLVTNNTGATVNDPTGLLFFHGYTINGGTSGNVILLGNSSVASANGCIGMDLAAWRENSYTANGIVRTVNGSINVVGRASSGTSHNLAIAIDATNTNGIKRNIFAATGSGSVSIDGLATGTSPLDVRLTNVDLLSGSGAITTIARGTSGIHIGGYNIGDGLFMGQKAGSLVESSSSAISLIADNIQLTKPLITNSTGALIIESLSNSFTSDITLSNKTTTAHSSLRIGKTTNTFNISIGGTTSIAGPINVYARTISIIDNLNTTTGSANGDVLLKSTADISVAASKSITTNAGDVILWSDSDSNNNGSISLLSAATIQTSGGKIVLAGGSDDGSNSGVASDGIPDGYSKGVGVAGISTTGSFNLNSGSGDILLRGSSTTVNGVLLSAATSGSINSAGGKIDIIGLVDVGSVINGGPSQTGIRTIGGGTITLDSGSGLLSLLGNGPRSGIGFGLNNANETDAATQTILKSSNTTAAAISIKGTGVHGITFRGATTKLHATAALGGITIDANSTIWSSTIYNPVEILAVSGPINWLNSTSSDGIYSETTSIALGSKSGVSGLTSSSSNINFYLNKLYGTPAFAFGTTGQVKIQGVDGTASFGQAFNTNTFGLNSNAQTMSAFTFGTPANTNDLTFGSATSIAGPITAYGGTITLNANLTTTNNGDISLYTDNPIAGLGTPRTLTAAGAFKYIPRGTTFSADVTYPIANLTVSNTGLTIGNTTNDKNITVTQDVTGGAGIELYGNNVNINANLTTTGTSTVMYIDGNTTIAAGKAITSGGNFTHDGNLVFKSDLNGTAAFGRLGGTFTKANTTSTTTVERYIPAKRAWRLLTAPLKGSANTTVPANWQGVTGEGLLLFSPATYQSQSMTGYTTGGGMPNIWKYDSTNTTWSSIPNITNENLFGSSVNNAFLVFATGPQASTNIATGQSETTLKPKGNLITGNVTHTLTASQYKLIGNPYASPLNTSLLRTDNPNTSFWFIDPSNGLGSYVSYSSSGDWSIPTVNSDAYIQSGQGFFVRNASAATFTISESHKVIGNSNTWFAKTTTTETTENADKIRVLLYKQEASNWQLADGILAVNTATGNNDLDATDTQKMLNFNENIMFKSGTTNLSIEYRALPQSGQVQPMYLTGTTAQPYQLRVLTEGYSNTTVTPFLQDTTTGTITPIPTDGTILTVPFTGIATTSTSPDQRFKIVYQNVALNSAAFNTLQAVVYPNPVNNGILNIHLASIETAASFTLTNLLGQTVHKGELNAIENSITLPELQQGVYIITIDQEGKKYSTKLQIQN